MSNLQQTRVAQMCDIERRLSCVHCDVSGILVVGLQPDRIPSWAGWREDGSVVCTHDKLVACGIRKVQALGRRLINKIPA